MCGVESCRARTLRRICGVGDSRRVPSFPGEWLDERGMTTSSPLSLQGERGVAARLVDGAAGAGILAS